MQDEPQSSLDDVTELRSDFRAFSANIAEFTRALDQAGFGQNTTQTVIHKSSSAGFITGVAVAACIGAFFFTMYVARTLNNDLRDMKAWQDVLRSKVSVIEGKLNGAKP